MSGSTPTTTFGELFSGPGGMGYGLKQAGLKPLWAIDNDQEACQTYKHNVGGHAICADITKVDFKALPHPDGLAFGFPCNDFSQVGEQKGKDGHYGQLYREASRALNVLEPTWFIAENVPGLMQEGGQSILQEFAEAGPGYRVSVHLYEFEQYRVPQRRHRIVAVGMRLDSGLLFRPPAPSKKEPISAKKALKGVETVKHNNKQTNHSKTVVERLKHIPEGENAWHPNVPDNLQLNVSGCRMSNIYRRLDRNEPSYTVTGSGGGGTHMYHYEEPRALTNRERARLQTFPDDFIFKGGKSSVRKQVGMAVPPRAGKQIGEALLKTINGHTYKSVQPSHGVLTPPNATRQLSVNVAAKQPPNSQQVPLFVS